MKPTYEELESFARWAQQKLLAVNKPHYHPEDYILNCHHIKPIKSGGNNQLENLISLCGKCHKVEHGHARNVARKHKPLIPEDNI